MQAFILGLADDVTKEAVILPSCPLTPIAGGRRRLARDERSARGRVFLLCPPISGANTPSPHRAVSQSSWLLPPSDLTARPTSRNTSSRSPPEGPPASLTERRQPAVTPP